MATTCTILHLISTEIAKTGIKQSSVPAGLQDWLAGRVLRILPEKFLKNLLIYLAGTIRDNEFVLEEIFDEDTLLEIISSDRDSDQREQIKIIQSSSKKPKLKKFRKSSSSVKMERAQTEDLLNRNDPGPGPDLSEGSGSRSPEKTSQNFDQIQSNSLMFESSDDERNNNEDGDDDLSQNSSNINNLNLNQLLTETLSKFRQIGSAAESTRTQSLSQSQNENQNSQSVSSFSSSMPALLSQSTENESTNSKATNIKKFIVCSDYPASIDTKNHETNDDQLFSSSISSSILNNLNNSSTSCLDSLSLSLNNLSNEFNQHSNTSSFNLNHLISDPISADSVSANKKRRRSAKFTKRCDNCNMTFNSLREMDRHNSKFHKIRPFKCEICNDKFTRRDVVLTHMKKKHPENLMARNDMVECSSCRQIVTKKGLTKHERFFCINRETLKERGSTSPSTSPRLEDSSNILNASMVSDLQL